MPDTTPPATPALDAAPLPAAPEDTGGASAVLRGGVAQALVGGAAAASAALVGVPQLTAQGLRYLAASAVLALLARARRVPLHRPRGAEWAWLAGVTGTGMLLFSLLLVLGSAHAEPAAMAVALACAPVALAVGGPLGRGRRPSGVTLAAAVVVTAGAVLVVGTGRTDAVGLLCALGVLVCEVCFTLLAVPLLARHGPWGVSVHTTVLAGTAFVVAALVVEGPRAAADLPASAWAATAYLALGPTVVAFVLWYGAVHRLGADRAGLLTGVGPPAAAVAGVLLGGPVPGPGVWAGCAVIVAGLALGLRITRR